MNGDSGLRHISMDDHGDVEHILNYDLWMIHDCMIICA